MTSMFLTREEVRELTERIQHSAQAKALRHMGFEFRVRADGSILVLRAHVEEVLGRKKTTRAPVELEPNWAAAVNEPSTPRRKSNSACRAKAAIFLNAAGVRFAVVCRVLMPGADRRATVQTTK